MGLDNARLVGVWHTPAYSSGLWSMYVGKYECKFIVKYHGDDVETRSLVPSLKVTKMNVADMLAVYHARVRCLENAR